VPFGGHVREPGGLGRLPRVRRGRRRPGAAGHSSATQVRNPARVEAGARARRSSHRARPPRTASGVAASAARRSATRSRSTGRFVRCGTSRSGSIGLCPDQSRRLMPVGSVASMAHNRPRRDTSERRAICRCTALGCGGCCGHGQPLAVCCGDRLGVGGLDGGPGRRRGGGGGGVWPTGSPGLISRLAWPIRP
jgi:hypothetical protein